MRRKFELNYDFDQVQIEAPSSEHIQADLFYKEYFDWYEGNRWSDELRGKKLGNPVDFLTWLLEQGKIEVKGE